MLHMIEVIKQQILESHRFTIDEVIYFLMQLELTIFINIDNAIEPDQIIVLQLNVFHSFLLDYLFLEVLTEYLSEQRTILIHLFKIIVLFFL